MSVRAKLHTHRDGFCAHLASAIITRSVVVKIRNVCTDAGQTEGTAPPPVFHHEAR